MVFIINATMYLVCNGIQPPQHETSNIILLSYISKIKKKYEYQIIVIFANGPTLISQYSLTVL